MFLKSVLLGVAGDCLKTAEQKAVVTTYIYF